MKKAEITFLSLLLLFVGILGNKFFLNPPLSADSWSYYELSKTVFFDFYKFSTYRSYENATAYSASFPPLWPTILALFNFCFKEGPRAGTLLNISLLPAIAISLEILSFKVFKTQYLGLIAFLICLTDTSFLDEVIAGRSIPFQVFLLINLFRTLLFVSKKSDLKEMIFSGVLLGLCFLNRFDAISVLPVVFIWFMFLRVGTTKVLEFASTFFITIFPWIVYSKSHFGSFWKTDNSFVAKAVAKSYVTDWYSAPIVTIREDFWAWFDRILGNVYPLLYSFCEGLWDISRSLGFALLALSLGLIFFKQGKKQDSTDNDTQNITFKYSILLGLLIAFCFGPNLLTGYFDLRYFVFQRMLIVLFSLGIVFQFFIKNKREPDLSSIAIFAFPCLLILAYLKLPQAEPILEKDPLSPAWVSEVSACIKAQNDYSAVFFLDTYNPFQFGAITELKTGSVPENFKDLNLDQRRKFFNSFKFSHILSKKDQKQLIEELGVELIGVECSPLLYKINNKA